MKSQALVSAFPSKRNAVLARGCFYFTMLPSLAYLLSVASDDERAADISKLVRMPLGKQVLNPRLFYLHDSLLAAMRAEDGETVDCLVAELQAIAQAGLHFDEIAPIDIRSVGDTDWETFIAKNAIAIGAQAFQRRPIIDPVADAVVDVQRPHILAAMELIRRHTPGMAEEMDAFLAAIRIFQGAVTMGVTDVRMFGCMFIRTPRDEVNPVLYYGEHITHEVSHMYLNAAMALDPIVLNDDDELFRSPIRPDPRPMMGVFHATFVTSRIVQLFKAMAETKPEEEVLFYLHQQLDELQAGIREIAQGARLTDVGRGLLAEFEAIARDADAAKFWDRFDRQATRMHRFGGGVAFKPADQTRDHVTA